MAKRKTVSTPSVSGDASGEERDLVTLFSRLTHTLELACGAAFADRLAALRQTFPDADEIKSAHPALSRAFRRLGLMNGSADVAGFAESLAERIGEAVSRPAGHVIALWLMFARGAPADGLRPVCGTTPDCQKCGLTRECEHFNNPRVPAMALLSPADRLMSGNDYALSDAELLAVLLMGDKATGQEEVVSTLLTRYGRLRAAFAADAHEFKGIRHMTSPQALRLAAVAALHRRLLAERRGEMLRIASAEDIHDRYAAELRDYRTEAAVLLLLDNQNCVVRDSWFCDGSPTMAHVNIADLLRPAIREFAPRIALVHNHPSNNPSPSAADMDFTRRLRSACDIVGLILVDHVIVCEAGYFSFAEKEMLGL